MIEKSHLRYYQLCKARATKQSHMPRGAHFLFTNVLPPLICLEKSRRENNLTTNPIFSSGNLISSKENSPGRFMYKCFTWGVGKGASGESMDAAPLQALVRYCKWCRTVKCKCPHTKWGILTRIWSLQPMILYINRFEQKLKMKRERKKTCGLKTLIWSKIIESEFFFK